VDLDALSASLDALLARHQTLRRRLVTISDGVGAQLVDEPWRAPVVVDDCRERSADEQRLAIATAQAEEGATPFDLASGRLLRVRVLQLSDAEAVVLLTLHHIVADGSSLDVLVRELSALYAGAVRGQAI